MSLLKSAYKVFRSIVISLIMLLVVLYIGLYVVLAIPSVQDKIKDRIVSEVSSLTGGEINIGKLTVNPFSEVKVSKVTLDSPDGSRCAEIDLVAAGIDLWKLLSERRVVLNYAEIIGLDVKVVQPEEHAPLNIQFLIDALSPKDKDKPATQFDLRIRNIVVRDSRASFSRPWMADESDTSQKWDDICIENLRMDLSIPVLRNDLFGFDIRNIQFDVTPGLSVRGISASVSYVKNTGKNVADRLLLKDFKIDLPESSLAFEDLDVNLKASVDVATKVTGVITPSDFKAFFPVLEEFGTPWNIDINASMNGRNATISDLKLDESQSGSFLRLRGVVEDYSRKDSLDIKVDEFKAKLASGLIAKVVGALPHINGKAKTALQSAGSVSLDLAGYVTKGDAGESKGSITTDIGDMNFSFTASALHSKRPRLNLTAEAIDVDFGEFLSTDKVGRASFEVKADVVGYDRNADGIIRLVSEDCELLGNRLSSVDLELNKNKHDIGLRLAAYAQGLSLTADGDATLAGEDTEVNLGVSVSGFNPSVLGLKDTSRLTEVSGSLSLNTIGDRLSNLCGRIDLKDAWIKRNDGNQLKLKKLSVDIDPIGSHQEGDNSSLKRDVRISSDWLDGNIAGVIEPASLATDLKSLAGSVFPILLSVKNSLGEGHTIENDFTFNFNIKDESTPYEFFGAPVCPLTDIPIKGYVDGPNGKANISISTPHLLQGKNKLIRDLDINGEIDAFLGMAKMNLGLIYPAKKGDAQLAAELYALNDNVKVNLDINPTIKSSVKGNVSFSASISRRPNPFKPNGDIGVNLEIQPSTITVGDMAWCLSESRIDYCGKRVSIHDFLLSHDEQYVKIDGVASENAEDQVVVKLNDIDLEYIFNILNINYVSFGGMASGKVVGSRLLTNTPEAKTEFLRVKGLSYNGAVIGDGDLASDFDSRQQAVNIYAVIKDPLTRQRRISVEGGIWVTRDSLSFGFDADRVNVGIMKPFVSAFCSELYGEASGRCKLYGTFSDIDLLGDLKADTLSMKLDFTNTWYHAGNDSVFLHKGVIDIPPLTVYDDEGHTAEFSGWLKHTYFHNPVFSFRLKDARSLLCYDTNQKINPLWYGTIYGTGQAQINGHPGLIDIDINMTTEDGSKFYYIINDAEDVAQYGFLTFTDRRKENMKAAAADTVPDYLKRYRKQVESTEDGSSNVILSMRGTVTNDVLVTLVMDQKAGDKITAKGQGALQMDYNLASNDLRMIGTYVLDEGNYNFTLQDIIIKNFNIRKGSLIKFNGDPMNANLDITATYRVNTNLTDLDESFANDKDLNRTNVPVDAVLQVDGPMTNPDITFDIELPSLTSDVERKVKSIVSTNDMMSRQIIYLLAMNRFYTPEYTAGSNRSQSGSEWSSLASSTISSQLSNILSQMTDKLAVAPSFRSDKGDFTDMEFDLALSSRLLNNRLLINGNFGYRDKNTSNTQFIGDFDIEYLLSKNGNVRLKAYNHFNDQNYYLRSALTTQGVGVVFRKDFDWLFRRKKKEPVEEVKEEKRNENEVDSVSQKINDKLKDNN